MTVKSTAASLIDNLDDQATWSDVKATIMKEYKKETGDARADSLAAIVLSLVFVTACIVWVSSQ